MEVHCSRDLAVSLGAIAPQSIDHHRALRDAGYLRLRDEHGLALFWPWQAMREEQVRPTAFSSRA